MGSVAPPPAAAAASLLPPAAELPLSRARAVSQGRRRRKSEPRRSAPATDVLLWLMG
jgi:hypothetical protein